MNTTLLGVAEALFSSCSLSRVRPYDALLADYLQSSKGNAKRLRYEWTEDQAQAAFFASYEKASEQAEKEGIEQLLSWLEKVNDDATDYARKAVAYEKLQDYMLSNFAALQSELAKTLHQLLALNNALIKAGWANEEGQRLSALNRQRASGDDGGLDKKTLELKMEQRGQENSPSRP